MQKHYVVSNKDLRNNILSIEKKNLKNQTQDQIIPPNEDGIRSVF